MTLLKPFSRGKACLAAAVLLLAGAAAGCAGAQASSEAEAPATGAPSAEVGNLLYVCVQDEAQVATIDMQTHEVVEVVDLVELGFSERSMPHDIAVEPDGSHWYVSLIGQNRVLRFNSANELVGELEMETPGMLDVHPTRDLLVVSRSMSAVNPPPRVGLARGSTMEVEEVDIFFSQPHGILVGPQGRFAYTASLGVNQLASIDLETERVELVDVEGPTHAFVQLAISPNGEILVASGEISGELAVFSLENPARPALVTSVEVGPQAFDPYFSRGGETVWVPIKGADQVVVVETEGWSVEEVIEGEGLLQPHALRFSPDGRWAFVTNNNKDPHAMHHPAEAEGGDGTVVVIDTDTRQIVRVLELGRNVTGMGLQPYR